MKTENRKLSYTTVNNCPFCGSESIGGLGLSSYLCEDCLKNFFVYEEVEVIVE